jgi:hypothetical protein
LIQPFLLILALMWLITSEPPRYLWFYISAQGAVTLCLYGTLVYYSESTYEYAHMWGICTVLLTAGYVTLAYHFLLKHPARWRAVVCAVLMSSLCSVFTYKHLVRHNLAAWLGLAAGAILIGTGIILCGMVPFNAGKDRAAALVLGLLFILQSLWNVGFVLHSSAMWDRANYVLPTILCLGAWGYLGIKLRSEQLDPLQQESRPPLLL